MHTMVSSLKTESYVERIMQWLESLSIAEWIGLAGVLVAGIGLYYTIRSHHRKRQTADSSIHQKTKGDVAPNIVSKGAVKISYGGKPSNN